MPGEKVEPARFAPGFSDTHERYHAVVTRRSLLKLHNLCIQGRREWRKAADPDFGESTTRDQARIG